MIVGAHSAAPGATTFDVVCAGRALWKVDARRSADVRLRPRDGAVSVALALARLGLRVGLATSLSDDAFGHASLARIAAAGVDASAVSFAPAHAGLLVVEASGAANDVPFGRVESDAFVEVPSTWSSPVLLLSGLSPLLAHTAALCKAARSARRRGATVVLDFNASLREWAGRDARTIRMVLREIDVARCTLADLAVLGMNAADARAALRPSAVLVVGHPSGDLVATGPFGAVAFAPSDGDARAPSGSGDALTAAICAELVAPAVPGESAEARFDRALRRSHADAIG